MTSLCNTQSPLESHLKNPMTDLSEFNVWNSHLLIMNEVRESKLRIDSLLRTR